jgi:hypothetical protein
VAYYVISPAADFTFTYGTGSLAGLVRLPWFRSVYLELVLVEDATLAIAMAPGVSGSVIVVPAREH